MLKYLRYLGYPPIYLFQMGKVGSSSLRYTLPTKYKGAIIHAHHYYDMSFKAKQFIKWRKLLHLPIFVICPVREPISRNISAFFQNFKKNMNLEFSDEKLSTIEMKELFLQNYQHNVGLEWFDLHFKRTFGFDVFTKPFPIEKKWNTYKIGSIRILIYRSDLDHDEQLAVVSNFIGYQFNNWIYKNKSENKEYSVKYREFCNTIKLPDSYIENMCHSKFFKHFWNEEEIIEYANKWRD